jgi:hypothetical protein
LAKIAKTFEPVELDEPPYPTTFRMPGYTVASTLAMLVTGTTSIQPLIDLQLLLDSLVPFLTFLILRRLTNTVCALIGGLLSVVWLPEAAGASLYYGTAPVPFLLTLSLWLYVEAIRRESLLQMALAGVVWLGIVFLRLELIFIALLLSALAAVVPLRARRLPLVLAPVVIVATGLAALTARNVATLGDFSLTSQVAGTMWQGMRYGSGLFPEYDSLSHDGALPPFLASRGILLSSAPGTFDDGPKGMEANRSMLRLLWTEVVRDRPGDLALHLAFKLATNVRLVRNWEDALKEFGLQHRVRLGVVATWIDLLVQVMPFMALVLVPWRDVHARMLAVPLVCLIGLHLALMLTGAGALRYTATVSPIYPMLASIILWLTVGRSRPSGDAQAAERSWVIVLTLTIVLLGFGWWRSAAWPVAASADLELDLGLMPVHTMDGTSLTRSGLTLHPVMEKTLDVNVAAGRPAIFSADPYYPGISGPDDAEQLTDGEVHQQGDHGSSAWVGWGMDAPDVFVGVPLERPAFVSEVRVHALHRRFPIAKLQVWEAKDSIRTLVASMNPPPSTERTTWLAIPVNQRLSHPVVELRPTDVRDRYIFIDEIQVLSREVYESQGEFVSRPLRLLERSPGVPTLLGEVPSDTSAGLWYRRAGTETWQANGWNARLFETPVEFRIRLRASPDGRRAPSVTHIVFRR